MQKIFKKPHLFFFGLIPIAFILAFIFRKETLDIIYYGGDLSITYWKTFIVLSILFCLTGLNYFALQWTKRKPEKWLTFLHILLQIISLILFVYYIIKIDTATEENEIDIINIILFSSLLLYIISVFIHLINFFISLLVKED